MSLVSALWTFLCEWHLLTTSQCCYFIPSDGITAISGQIKQLSVNSALLRLSFPTTVNTFIDLTTDDALKTLTIFTYPPLIQGVDFELYSLAKENSLPISTKKTDRGKYAIGLRLLPGKSWIKNASIISSTKLFIVGAYVCHTNSHPPPDYSDNSTWSQVAVIANRKISCPKLPPLPGARPGLSALLESSLRNCQMLRAIKSKKLDWKRFSSLSLLSMEPPLLLVDGSDQDMNLAAKSVDAFLSAHSVLEVVWEPYFVTEPQWWVLVPRPPGMPGHLLAMIDMIQWNHPYVAKADEYKALPLCNETISGCIPGCPKTRVKGITGSGWGADTFHIVEAFQRFFVDFTPMQAGPFRLGYRYTPPLWGGTIGWLYTYKGCDSNFLDCYFLDHSPCPRINLDTFNDPGVSNFDIKRFDSERPDNHGWLAKPKWWSKVMGEPTATMPEESIRDLHGLPARHAFYAYFFRPKYDLRRIIHEKMEQFGLNDECAVMHVRRGDSIMHGGKAFNAYSNASLIVFGIDQARGYLRVDAYVRAARPLMDAMGIKTILLLSDSQGAIDEARRCAAEHPTICGGIVFRFLEKKRWIGAEGGWENPFPSGEARTELIDLQLEFALAQKAKMAIVGESNYAEKIMEHMCCGYPLSSRGVMPHRCICPPYVNLKQYGFDCQHGNRISCELQDKGGDITRPLDDPTNMYGANFSLQATAFIQSATVCLNTPTSNVCYDPDTSAVDVNEKIVDFVDQAVSYSCRDYDNGPEKPEFCKKVI